MWSFIHASTPTAIMTSSNGNIFGVTAFCAGNSPVPGEFPAQRPVTRSFDVFFDLRLNIRLSKQSRSWWFETPSRSLWRHCHGVSVKPTAMWGKLSYYISMFMKMKSHMTPDVQTWPNNIEAIWQFCTTHVAGLGVRETTMNSGNNPYIYSVIYKQKCHSLHVF